MLNLLIVDDEKAVSDTILEKIPWSEIGFSQVVTAKNGIDAMEKCYGFYPDICLSDIKMPKMNGIQLGYCLKERFPESQLIYLSGYTDKEYLKEAIDLHVVGYIEKPIDLEEIRKTVSRAAAKLILSKEKMKQGSTEIPPSQFYETEIVQNISYSLPDSLYLDFRKNLETNSIENAERLIVRLTRELSTSQDTHINYVLGIYYQLISILISVCQRYPGNGLSAEQQDSIWSRARERLTLQALSSFIIDLLHTLCQSIPSSNPLVYSVQQYVRENYKDFDLSISKIADFLHMNGNYLNTIFRKETDSTITQYITQVRIDAAKELLADKEIRSYEISEKVGISDPNYFSTVFKKITGMSPRQYRERFNP